MGWNTGRGTIDQMITNGQLDNVPPSREQADSLVAAARAHLASSAAVQANDPDGAYGLLYDAARKALAAILANQGLRTTTRGGHVAVYDAASAQLVPPMGDTIRPFNRMRRRRNQVEYPSIDDPGITADEVANDHARATAIVDTAARVIPEMGVY